MNRIVAVFSLTTFAVLCLSCGGGGETANHPDPEGQAKERSRVRRQKILAVKYEEGAEVTIRSEHPTGAVDLESLRHLYRLSLDLQFPGWETYDLRGESQETKTLWKLFSDKKLVELKKGVVGVYTGKSGEEEIDRGDRWGPTHLIWIEVKFKNGSFFVSKHDSLEKSGE